MRTGVTVAIALLGLLSVAGALSAQSAPAAALPPAISVTLVYHENNSGNFEIRDEKGNSLGDPSDGDTLKVGWTILTYKGDLAELKMNHTGTIIRVAGMTNFRLDELRTDTGGRDVFGLAIGKVRAVAGTASARDLCQIRSQSAVCGVSGCDVIVETFDGIELKITTLQGTGFLQRAAGGTPGRSLDVAQGFDADTGAAEFKPFPVPADVLQGLRDGMRFARLDVDQAMGLTKESPAPKQETPETKPVQNPPTPPSLPTNSAIDNILTAMRKVLGLEVGSFNAADPANPGQTLTYAMAVFEPEFSSGKLTMALYLPVIFRGDMFSSSNWYRPSGNREWSFGSDQQGFTNQAADFTRDLLLKIKYIEYGSSQDSFFLKAGNLDDITMGHGLVMQHFSNDADYPSVRHVGVSAAVDTPEGGLEAMASDVAPDLVGGSLEPPDIVAARSYVRPIPGFRAALGASAVIDFNPARDFVDPLNGISTPSPAAAGYPIFITPGVDLEVPFLERDTLGLIFFADGALMVPYFLTFPTDPAYSGIGRGFAVKGIYESTASIPVKNWGVATGLLGNAIIPGLTYKVQYQLFTGSFRPQVYDSGYSRNRAGLVLETLDYLANSGADSAYTMGIYGEARLKMKSLFTASLGYFWPWTYDSSSGKIAGDPAIDHFLASFTLEKGVIPTVNVWGGISYERTGFAETLQATGLSGALFDAHTVVSARINYTVAPTMDLSLIYSVAAARDVNGNLSYTRDPSLPDMTTSVSLELQIHP